MFVCDSRCGAVWSVCVVLFVLGLRVVCPLVNAIVWFVCDSLCGVVRFVVVMVWCLCVCVCCD